MSFSGSFHTLNDNNNSKKRKAQIVDLTCDTDDDENNNDFVVSPFDLKKIKKERLSDHLSGTTDDDDDDNDDNEAQLRIDEAYAKQLASEYAAADNRLNGSSSSSSSYAFSGSSLPSSGANREVLIRQPNTPNAPNTPNHANTPNQANMPNQANTPNNNGCRVIRGFHGREIDELEDLLVCENFCNRTLENRILQNSRLFSNKKTPDKKKGRCNSHDTGDQMYDLDMFRLW